MRIAALIFAVGFPTLVTWIYFVALEGGSPALQQGAYSVGKVLQFSFPLLWLLGRRVSLPKVSAGGVLTGVAFGGAIAALMLAIYFGFLGNSELFRGPIEAVRAKTAGMGLNSPGKFIALGVFYSLGHAFLEEYYWRWFVFGTLCRGIDRDEKPLLNLPQSIALSSLGFAAHHVLIVARFFWLAEPADVSAVVLRRDRRRCVGLAVRTRAVAGRGVAQPFAGRRRDIRHRLRDDFWIARFTRGGRKHPFNRRRSIVENRLQLPRGQRGVRQRSQRAERHLILDAIEHPRAVAVRFKDV